MTEEQAARAHEIGRRLEIKLRSWPITERSVLTIVAANINLIVLALKDAKSSSEKE